MKEIIQHRVVVTVALAVVALVAWAILLYQPTRNRIEKARVDVASLDQEVTTARQFLTTTAEAMDNGGWMRQRQEMLTSLCRVDSLEDFVDRLAADFSRFGVTHAEFAPDLNELLKEHCIQVGSIVLVGGRFQARCQGRFISLGKALANLEKQPYFNDLYSLTISYNDATNPDVLCTMDFGVYLRNQKGAHD